MTFNIANRIEGFFISCLSAIAYFIAFAFYSLTFEYTSETSEGLGYMFVFGLPLTLYAIVLSLLAISFIKTKLPKWYYGLAEGTSVTLVLVLGSDWIQQILPPIIRLWNWPIYTLLASHMLVYMLLSLLIEHILERPARTST